MHAQAVVDLQSESQAQQELPRILVGVYNLVRRLGDGPAQRSRDAKAEMMRKVVHGNALRRDHLRIKSLRDLLHALDFRALYQPEQFHCDARWPEYKNAV